MNTRAGKAVRGGERRREVAQPIATASDPEARAADHEVKVALAAYFIAEKRGFGPGHELDDWLAAEAQIAAAESPEVTRPIQPVKVESAS